MHYFQYFVGPEKVKNNQCEGIPLKTAFYMWNLSALYLNVKKKNSIVLWQKAKTTLGLPLKSLLSLPPSCHCKPWFCFCLTIVCCNIASTKMAGLQAHVALWCIVTYWACRQTIFSAAHTSTNQGIQLQYLTRSLQSWPLEPDICHSLQWFRTAKIADIR